MRQFIWVTVLVGAATFQPAVFGQATAVKLAEYTTVENVAYRDEDSQTDYMKERCKLNVYYPSTQKNFSTVVWFHGGGLKEWPKICAGRLAEKGIAVVAVNYRLHPKVKSPAYLEDAAAAVAWTIKNIETYGGAAGKSS